ncbi:virulence RhuM family protein [Escherichia coli]|nr:virulence RhuM family protein [Escherichia coli]
MAILTPVIFRQFASSDVLQSLVILSIQIFSICSIFNRLQEYLIKSFVMDDEQLKNPPVGSSVLERIRDIRASMRRVYLQVICPPADSQPTVSPLR